LSEYKDHIVRFEKYDILRPVFGDLTAPGGPFEIVDEIVLGERMAVFRHRPRSARDLLLESSKWGSAEYLVLGDARLTFETHLEQVAALATALREEYGVQKGDRVALLAANSPSWVIGFWATVSIGAVVASMNAWWAAPELAHALETCEPKVVIGDRERIEQISESAVPRAFACIAIETDVPLLIARWHGRALPDARIDEDDPAVILYTSGTTGRSKGAVASHRSLCGFVTVSRYSAAAGAAAAQAAGSVATAAVGTPQVALVTVPLFHASGLYGFVVGQLASGGAIVLRAGRFDEDDVLRLIERERVTMWAALGSMGPRVAQRAAQSGRDLSSMRVLAIGGAPVSPAHQAQLREAFPNASLNISMGYTSSEAVAVVTRIQGDELRTHPTSAGRSMVTTEIEIRDADGRAVAEGVDGEIHVRSPYLMIEYWRDPVSTNAVLKPGRWLAMGDVGCLREGRLYINSRARDMILVNAENVFPTEIEFRLDAHPAVRESAVVGVDDETTGQAIRAVVVVHDGATVTEDELHTWCRAAMAGYKVPTQWILRREALPRNPSGKVLKRELG
jgi:long-chain acyl-CoA synthetase